MAKLSPKIESFARHPDSYRHWRLTIDGNIATLLMHVAEDEALDGQHDLVLNSYDIAVDIELADCIRRLRFEHPAVDALIITSGIDRVFCAGANIRVLANSSHAFKVNFCKFTNETRLELEEASAVSGLRSLAALNGTASGGGYELAAACNDILLVDDRSSAVSLPETPLLGVLPGTGGLTRVVDKRKVRPDLADVFSTTAEGVKGKRAVDWGLVDAIAPLSRFQEATAERAEALANSVSIDKPEEGIAWTPINPTIVAHDWRYQYVHVALNHEQRIATICVEAPGEVGPTDPAEIRKLGASWWPLAVFRELEDAILRLRFNAMEVGTWVLRTKGDSNTALAFDALLDEHKEDWFIGQTRHLIKWVLKRLEVSARSIFAMIDESSCFSGTLFELALAADRIYMLDEPDEGVSIHISAMNGGGYPMANGLSRLETRFLANPSMVAKVLEHAGQTIATLDADELGLVTDAPDDLDWDDTIRIAIEERVSLSPDALTGMEANLRFPGPETLETKIFGRLSAWQNWIFIRPNAVGPDGALTLYGQPQRPKFDWNRT